MVRRRAGHGCSAALAVHRARIRACVGLLLPDRHTLLDLVDDVAAGEEGLVAVRRAHAHPHRELPDAQVPEPVHARRPCDAKAREGLGEDALALAHREGLEGFVLEPPHALALVRIAYPAFEGGVAAAGGSGEVRPEPL